MFEQHIPPIHSFVHRHLSPIGLEGYMFLRKTFFAAMTMTVISNNEMEERNLIEIIEKDLYPYLQTNS